MRVVYEKFVNGDLISDAELADGVKFFKDLSNMLDTLGPVFRLSANESRRVYLALRGYLEARQEKG